MTSRVALGVYLQANLYKATEFMGMTGVVEGLMGVLVVYRLR